MQMKYAFVLFFIFGCGCTSKTDSTENSGQKHVIIEASRKIDVISFNELEDFKNKPELKQLAEHDVNQKLEIRKRRHKRIKKQRKLIMDELNKLENTLK